MNWNIGQYIVCIKDHSQGVIKKGQTFIVKDIRIKPCCRYSQLDIGFSSYAGLVSCCIGRKDELVGKTDWFNETLFAPIDLEEISIEEAFENANELQEV